MGEDGGQHINGVDGHGMAWDGMALECMSLQTDALGLSNKKGPPSLETWRSREF